MLAIVGSADMLLRSHSLAILKLAALFLLVAHSSKQLGSKVIILLTLLLIRKAKYFVRLFISNLLSVFVYATIILFYGCTVKDAGDIIIMFVGTIAVLIHLLIVVVNYWNSKSELQKAICGLCIGVVISFLIFKKIEMERRNVDFKVRPTIVVHEFDNEIYFAFSRTVRLNNDILTQLNMI
jgi:hypothetical protein